MDKKEIEHLAELSKLKFSDDELKSFADDFKSLLELTDIVKDAEINGEIGFKSIDMNALREDEPKESMTATTLLENAPQVKNDCIVVPRIME